LFGYACFMCSPYVLGLLSALFWLLLRQGLAFWQTWSRVVDS